MGLFHESCWGKIIRVIGTSDHGAAGHVHKTHLPGILNAQMTQASHALNRDGITAASNGISQYIEDSNSRAEQRRCFIVFEFVGHGSDGFGR